MGQMAVKVIFLQIPSTQQYFLPQFPCFSSISSPENSLLCSVNGESSLFSAPGEKFIGSSSSSISSTSSSSPLTNGNPHHSRFHYHISSPNKSSDVFVESSLFSAPGEKFIGSSSSSMFSTSSSFPSPKRKSSSSLSLSLSDLVSGQILCCVHGLLIIFSTRRKVHWFFFLLNVLLFFVISIAERKIVLLVTLALTVFKILQ